MKTKRTVLVIEDNEINREMLAAILSSQYNVIQAENGEMGLQLLEENRSKISLILLDIQMPVMNGYQFLDAMREKNHYASIPIIVTTSSASSNEEIYCLENGASDFIPKPYDPEIVIRRVNSMIRLSESSAAINRVEQDVLTGMYSKDFFNEHMESHLRDNPDSEYDVICSDIQSFKIINTRYGIKSADDLLVCVAKKLIEIPDSICGRIGVDSFAALTPHKDFSFYGQLISDIEHEVKLSPVPNAIVNLGLYSGVDHNLSATAICDNAMLAIVGIRQKYRLGAQIAEFDETLKNKLMREQMIKDTMEYSLNHNQFEVYYQMKFDLINNRIGGAEALIRWHHPDLGFMNPNEFIPLFEKNGFISKLDKYIAKRVCSDLRNWMDEGYEVVPISVNISRVDFDDPNLANDIQNTADVFGIPHKLLHIEVTESAYTETPDQIYKGVEELREMGFPIELDDFGSGYSSLTVLNDLDLDVLKLDMNLVKKQLSDKRKLILLHIFSIADNLHMEVVAEGIETKEQVEAFREMGCKYAQGYYFSKPLPKDQFEKHLTHLRAEE